MKKVLPCLLLTLSLTACSVEIREEIPTPHAIEPTATWTPAATLPSVIRPPSQPVRAQPTTVPTIAALPWADRHVNGRLIFTQNLNQLAQLDLATGALTTLFQAPDKTWLTAAAPSPDGAQMVIAYAPPPSKTQPVAGLTDLFLLPATGSGTPTRLLERTQAAEEFFSPTWSPDGSYIYFVHTTPIHSDSPDTDNPTKYTIERLPYPGYSKPQVVVENAMWPRLSPDGQKLAYVALGVDNSLSDLYLANPDGTHPKLIVKAGTFPAVDAPLFSPDGHTLIFSAVNDPLTPALSWLDRLLGVQIASAHNVPSDWWQLPTTGGDASRLTQIHDTGLYGDFSADGQSLAFISASGVYLMNSDGSGLLQIHGAGAAGTVVWVK